VSLHRAKLPVMAAVDRPIRSLTGVPVPLRSGSIYCYRSLASHRSRWSERITTLSPDNAGIRVVWMEGFEAQPDGRQLLMPHRPADPTSPSQLPSSGRPASNASAQVAIHPRVEPAERDDLTDAATVARSRSGRRSGSSDRCETGTHARRRSTVASHAQFGVRRPIMASMPPERREQAISAIAALLMVQLEREAQPPALDARGRGRVADSGTRQEGEP
jgi:hypothetical protein